jgi:HAD superfamily hydrolase (TIGR01509 family)
MSIAPPTSRMPGRLPGAVVLDMDGLMLDSERIDREIWQGAMRRRGYEFPDALHAALIGHTDVDGEHVLRAHFGAELPLAELAAEAQSLWREHIATRGVPRKPGLNELLDHLEAERIPVAVATSTARAKAIERLGPLAARFDALVFGDEVTNGKPAPDIYLLAAERLGRPPADCLALEDSPAGVIAAEAAGMMVIMIPDLLVPTTAPRYQCASLLEVAAWLARGRRS